jgi:hypothetical protein
MDEVVERAARDQIELYRGQPLELISHYNREQSALDSYRGRQVLELLQNADDEGASSEAAKVHFVLDRQRLIVANTGEPFTFEGLMSLVISDCSPKQQSRDRFIGSKGLGFRSVLTWTNRPMIVSGGLRVRFDRSIGVDIARELAERPDGRRITAIKEMSGAWPVPTMRFPGLPNPGDPDVELCKALLSQGFDTTIVLPLKGGQGEGDGPYDEVRKQLLELPTVALLFCRHLTEIRLSGDVEGLWELDRESVSDGRDRVVISRSGSEPELWEIYRSGGKLSVPTADGSTEFEMAVAVPEKPRETPEHYVCVFFPTHNVLPAPVVLHATLALKDDRNRIVDSPGNRQVLRELAVHVSEVMARQTTERDPWRGISLSSGLDQADPELRALGFSDAIQAALKDAVIVPCRDGRFRKPSEALLAPHAVWAAVGGSDDFGDFIAAGAPVQEGLLAWVGVEEASSQVLRERLALSLVRCDAGDAGRVVGQLLKERQLQAVGAQENLRLEGGGPVDGATVFLRSTTPLPQVPSWSTRIRFLDASFQEALQKSSGVETGRSLCERLSECGVKVQEYGLETVARALMSELNSLSLGEEKEQEHWVKLLVWLFGAVGPRPASLEQLPIKLPTRGHGLQRATECYLSNSYPNGLLAWRLYKAVEEVHLVADPQQMGLAGVTMEEAEVFLRATGVAEFPRWVPVRSGEPTYRTFLDHVIDSQPFPANIRDVECAGPDEVRSQMSPGLKGLKVPQLLAEVLRTSDPEAIVEYLDRDGTLLEKATGDCVFTAKIGREWSPRLVPHVRVESLTRYLLRNVPWVLCDDGDRHIPSSVILTAVGPDLLRGVYHRHVLGLNPGERALPRKEVDALLMRLGAVNAIEDMGDEQVCQLLMALPERDPDGKAAPGIYRTLLDSRLVPGDGPIRRRFAAEGMVWAEYQGHGTYVSLADARYSANVTLPRRVEQQIPLVAVPKRRGTRSVQGLLGVQPLHQSEIVFKVRDESVESGEGAGAAQARLLMARPFVYALRLGRRMDEDFRELRLLQSLVLRPIKRVDVELEMPGRAAEVITFDTQHDKIAVKDQLFIVGDYEETGPSETKFWIGVAGLVAEVLDTDVAAEVGMVLRCSSEREMEDVAMGLLEEDGAEKLREARDRIGDLPVLQAQGHFDLPTPREDREGGRSGDEIGDEESDDQPAGPSNNDDAQVGDASSFAYGAVFQRTTAPAGGPRGSRRLVVRGRRAGASKSTGPIATEDRTFPVVEAFELQEGRWPIDVSHLQGRESLGCDWVSVASEEVMQGAIVNRVIRLEDITRFIEVKGSSARSGPVELTENELRKASSFGERYFLYRVHVSTRDTDEYELAVLQNPLNSSAVHTIRRFDLREGSGAEWYAVGHDPAQDDPDGHRALD